jgi:threonine dehydratase
MTQPSDSVATGYAPTYAEIAAAAQRLAGRAYRTPLLRAPPLPGRPDATVLVKAETLQRGGAFKFRGAYNCIAQLDEKQKAAGVVAWSSGNHAQGVAAAAQMLGMHATIVMPADAPAIKVENTRGFGAEVVFYDRARESREDIGRAIAARNGAAIVAPYDDPRVIAGQGTVAVEMVEQARELGVYELDAVLTPVGGGGLIAGCSLALRELSPKTEVYGVEPVGFDDTARSLASGRQETNPSGSKSLCDALQAKKPGDLTFPINRRLVRGVFTISDPMVLAAMAWAWRELKLVVEPGGAAALAAVLHGLHDCSGKTVGVVLSGGNVDASVYAQALGQ